MLNYSKSSFPNFVGHDTSIAASEGFQKISPLLDQGLFLVADFVCYLHFPSCYAPLPPCRTLCSFVKIGLEIQLKKFGLLWPDIWRCNRFPESRNPNVCMGTKQLLAHGVIDEIEV